MELRQSRSGLLSGLLLSLCALAWTALGGGNIPTMFMPLPNSTCTTSAPSAFTWTGGGGDANWDTPTNWFGSNPPSATDVAIFDGNCTVNCSPTINVSISVAGINMKCDYGGTIAQGAGNTITVGASNWSQANGVFAGGNANITINGQYIQTGGSFSGGSGNILIALTNNLVTMFNLTAGTFTSTSGSLTIRNYQGSAIGYGSITLVSLGPSAVFQHNNGTVNLEGQDYWGGNSQFTLQIGPGNLDLYNVNLDSGIADYGQGHRLPPGQTITVLNDFTIANGNAVGGNSANPTTWGTWILKGANNNFNSGNGNGGGSYGTVEFAGTGNQTYSCGMDSSHAGPYVKVNKSSGTLTTTSPACAFAGITLQQGSFTAPSGTLYLGFLYTTNSSINLSQPWNILNVAGGTTFNHNNGTVYFKGDDNWSGNGKWVATVPSNFALFNVVVDGRTYNNTGFEISSGSIVVQNTFDFLKGRLYGDWIFQGNVTINSALALNTDTGPATLTFTGTNNQDLIVLEPLPTGLLTVNKTGGALYVQRDTALSYSGQGLTVTSGTLDMWGSNLNINGTLTIDASGTLLCNSGTLSYGSLTNNGTLNCADATHTFTSVGSVASAQDKTSSNTFAFSPSAQINSGNLAILIVAADNLSTVDGNNNEHTSVTDSVGNTWKKRGEFTNSRGSSSTGSTVSVWSARVITSIATSDTIGVTFSGNVTAKAVTGWQFSFTGAPGFVVAGSATVADVGADPTNLSLSGLTSNQYLWLRAIGSESDGTTWTSSTNYTGFTHTNSTTSGAGAASNMGARAEFRVFTGTGDSTDPTAVSADHASVYIAIK